MSENCKLGLVKFASKETYEIKQFGKETNGTQREYNITIRWFHNKVGVIALPFCRNTVYSRLAVITKRGFTLKDQHKKQETWTVCK